MKFCDLHSKLCIRKYWNQLGNQMADSRRTRAKTKEVTRVDAGRGVPLAVAQTLKKGTDQVTITGNRNVGRRSTLFEKITRRSIVGGRKSIFDTSNFVSLSLVLDLDEYEFPEQEAEDPADKVRLDVTALDRYNDDIRKLRRMTIDECRNFPSKGEPDEGTLMMIRLTVRSLCRTAFFGNKKAQTLAEGSVILVVWLLNKKNVTSAFKVHLLQSFAEMIWTSDELKYALFKCNGMRVLVKLLVKGALHSSDQARWACYTLAMSCIGCKEIINAVQSIPQLEQVVGELAFHAYWANWPANFGQVLQGILYGPHSVIPVEDDYQFL